MKVAKVEPKREIRRERKEIGRENAVHEGAVMGMWEKGEKGRRTYEGGVLEMFCQERIFHIRGR